MGEAADSAALSAEVQCILPGAIRSVASVTLTPGCHSLDKIAQDLHLPVPLLGLLPLDGGVIDADCDVGDRKVNLKAGCKYKTLLGAAPLIRFSVKDKQSRPHLCEEGLWLLRNIASPVYVAAFIGLGRCGKSTTCSALARVSQGLHDSDVKALDCFPSAEQNKPVTAGADVAALISSKDGRCLLIIDCEGSDNALSKDLQNCRTLATIAFAFASHIVFCTGDNFRESAIDELGAAVATRDLVEASQEISFLPKVCFLMLKQNVSADSAEVEEAFGAFGAIGVKVSSRYESRCAIREICGGGLPDVRNLVNFKESGNEVAYKEAIVRLHDDLCQSSASEADLHFTGVQLVDVLTDLCKTVATCGKFERESASTSIVRGHLQMIMKACVDGYEKALPAVERYCDEKILLETEMELKQTALARFDERTQKVGKNSSSLATTRSELRQDMEMNLNEIYQNRVMKPNSEHKAMEEREATRKALAKAKAEVEALKKAQEEREAERARLKDATDAALAQAKSKARCMTTASIILFVALSFTALVALLVLQGVVSFSSGMSEPVQSIQRAAESSRHTIASVTTSTTTPQNNTIIEAMARTAAHTVPLHLPELLSEDVVPSDTAASNSSANTTSSEDMQGTSTTEVPSEALRVEVPPTPSLLPSEALGVEVPPTPSHLPSEASHACPPDQERADNTTIVNADQERADYITSDDGSSWFSWKGLRNPFSSWTSFAWPGKIPGWAPRRVLTLQHVSTPALCGVVSIAAVATGWELLR
jgi:hypothetical protein